MLSYLNDSYSFRTSLHILFYMGFWLLLAVEVINSYDIDSLKPENIDDGENFYEKLIEKAESYGGCWKDALTDIDSNCRTLNEEKNSRLALSFSNCLLKHAGRRPINDCPKNEFISDCLERISAQDFHTYRAFFIHTQSICHYLQHKERQEETAKTALILSENTRTVSKKLDQTVKKQYEVLDLLNHSVLDIRMLNADLQQSRKTVQSLQMEVNSVSDQNLQLFASFHEVKRLMDYVIGFGHICLATFYFLVAGVFSLILTSPCQTFRARWPMLIASLFSYFIIEPLYSLLVNYSEENLVTNEILYERIWCRIKINCVLWFIILIYYCYHYEDQNAVVSELKDLILQTNEELRETRGILKSREYITTEKNRSFLIQELDSVDESGFIDEENSFVENRVLQDIGNICAKRRRASSERVRSNESSDPNSLRRTTRLSSHLR